MIDFADIKMVADDTDEAFASVPVRFIEVEPGQPNTQLAPGIYFSFPPAVDQGSHPSEVFVHGPYDDREIAELAAGDFLLTAAEARAREILAVAQDLDQVA